MSTRQELRPQHIDKTMDPRSEIWNNAHESTRSDSIHVCVCPARKLSHRVFKLHIVTGVQRRMQANSPDYKSGQITNPRIRELVPSRACKVEEQRVGMMLECEWEKRNTQSKSQVCIDKYVVFMEPDRAGCHAALGSATRCACRVRPPPKAITERGALRTDPRKRRRVCS